LLKLHQDEEELICNLRICLGDVSADPSDIVAMLRERNLLQNYIEQE
jgi:hypothetical protein